MSIISREAELKYPAGVPGMDPAPLRSGYTDGADREWTDIEITAAAEAALGTCKRLWRNAEHLGMGHDGGLELDIARAAVTAAWQAARAKALEETE